MFSTPAHRAISVGSLSFGLILQDQTPYVECEGHFYNHIWLLVQQFPQLSELTFLKEFAEISNFLWKGDQYRFIDQIAAYQKFYLEQIDKEKQCPGDLFPYRLTDYKIFEISVMHDPQVEEGQLYYYVYQTATALPYRVVCPFPYTSHATLVHYQILPLKSEIPLP